MKFVLNYENGYAFPAVATGINDKTRTGIFFVHLEKDFNFHCDCQTI